MCKLYMFNCLLNNQVYSPNDESENALVNVLNRSYTVTRVCNTSFGLLTLLFKLVHIHISSLMPETQKLGQMNTKLIGGPSKSRTSEDFRAKTITCIVGLIFCGKLHTRV